MRNASQMYQMTQYFWEIL